MNHRFLVETCLLTHGLASVTDEMLLEHWPEEWNCIVWVDRGEVRIGGMRDFIPFRRRSGEVCRIDCDTFADAVKNGVSGALTASGTMRVCQELGIGLAVTCGMGGLGDIVGEELCPDLPALERIPVSLISTAPKDMLDIEGTIRWLTDRGVQVLGAGTDRCTGYIFRSTDIPLSGQIGTSLPQPAGKLLILNPIPEADRIQDLSLLSLGVAEAKEAEKQGGYFHPAANAAYDRLSKGWSSVIQMHSLVANATLANRLTK
ncbi:MAG: pseudouridine-5'-phosphate glycosidase [Oscillospiraceae bacterium]|nr:pseudouridine-5'-phosphate glycosidase [Oscillospiraceae bacterium]